MHRPLTLVAAAALAVALSPTASASWQVLATSPTLTDADGRVPATEIGPARCGAVAHVDADGVLDLATGHATDAGGAVVVYRGDERFRQGLRRDLWREEAGLPPVPAFRNQGTVVELPFAPDWIAVGDLDADGDADVACAARGHDRLAVLVGDGAGRFGATVELPLPGPVAAFAAGDVDRGDFLTDLVVAIDVGAGGAVLVYEDAAGALSAEPEWHTVAAPVTDLAIGPIDEDPWADVAVAADDVVMVFGRDRRLAAVVDDARPVAPARIEVLELATPARDLVFGHFVGGSYRQLAVRRTDGAVELVEAADGRLARRAVADLALPAHAGTHLVATRTSGAGTHELLVAGGDRASLELAGVAATKSGELRRETRGAVDVGASIVLPARLNRDARDDLVLLGAGVAPVVVKSAPRAVYVVNSTADTDDGACNASNCTLREAIDALNAAPISSSIVMNLGLGATVTLGSNLPLVQKSGAELDGTVGSGMATSWLELDGTSCSDCSGLETLSDSTTIATFVLGGFVNGGSGTTRAAIFLDSDDNLVEQCLVGVDLSNGAVPNNIGVLVRGGDDSVIGASTAAARNVISNNVDHGVLVWASDGRSHGNRVIGSYIGTDRYGNAAAGNGGDGVRIATAGANYVGTALSGEGNVLAANTGSGVALALSAANAASAAYVLQNLIGVTKDGVTSMPNGDSAILVDNQRNTTVGGFNASARNIIAGDADTEAVTVIGDSGGTAISGNSISLGSDGTTPLPSRIGVLVASQVVTIGGTTDSYGNLIGGNTYHGVKVGGDGVPVDRVDVLANVIGTDLSQQTALPNGTSGVSMWLCADCSIGDATYPESGNVIVGAAYPDEGIDVRESTNLEIANNRIGVTDAGAAMGNGGDGITLTGVVGCDVLGNTIANSGWWGIRVDDWWGDLSTEVRMFRNLMWSNTELGIDLDGNGVTNNDPGDNDGGCNGRQNYPEITGHDPVTGTVSATLDSRPSRTYGVQLYESSSCHATGHGEGEVYLGRLDVTTDGSGDVAFSMPATVTPGAWLTMLATDPDGNTSEFSECFQAATAPDLPFSDGFESGDFGAWSTAVP